jgi:glutaredoxin-like YruB-family protein
MPKTVSVYSTPTCHYCLRAKQFLKDNNIIYQDFDVSRDEVKAQEMISKTGQMGVPVFDIDGEIIMGFDKAKIAQALGL